MMKLQMIVIGLFLMVGCQTAKDLSLKRLEELQNDINWYCVNIDMYSDYYEDEINKRINQPSWFDPMNFKLADTLYDTSSINLEFFNISYANGYGENYVHLFWTNDDKGYLINMVCDTFSCSYPKCKNMKYVELTEAETNHFVELYNKFLPEEELYVYQYFNCSGCIDDGGGNIFLLKKNGKNIYYYENENCFENFEKTLLGLKRHYLIEEIKQTFRDTWKKYYPTERAPCN